MLPYLLLYFTGRAFAVGPAQYISLTDVTVSTGASYIGFDANVLSEAACAQECTTPPNCMASVASIGDCYTYAGGATHTMNVATQIGDLFMFVYTSFYDGATSTTHSSLVDLSVTHSTLSCFVATSEDHCTELCYNYALCVAAVYYPSSNNCHFVADGDLEAYRTIFLTARTVIPTLPGLRQSSNVYTGTFCPSTTPTSSATPTSTAAAVSTLTFPSYTLGNGGSGYMLLQLATNDFAECQEKCVADLGCIVADFGGGGCITYSGEIQTLTSDSDHNLVFSFGARFYTKNPTSTTHAKLSNIDINIQSNLGCYVSTSEDNCAEICNSVSTCLGAMFNPSTMHCKLATWDDVQNHYVYVAPSSTYLLLPPQKSRVASNVGGSYCPGTAPASSSTAGTTSAALSVISSVYSGAFTAVSWASTAATSASTVLSSSAANVPPSTFPATLTSSSIASLATATPSQPSATTVTSLVTTTATETDANFNMNNGLNPTTTQQSATSTATSGPNEDCITIKAAFPQVQFNVDCWNVGANSTYSVDKSQIHRRRGKKRDSSAYLWFNQGHLIHVILPRLGLSTSIPPQLGNLGKTLIIDLSGNNIVGSIPPQLGQISDLIILKLDGNAISGSIPPELGNLHNLQTLELSRNQITGSIPVELAQLTNLHVFSIAENELTGNIPPALLTTLANTGAVTNFGVNCLNGVTNQSSGCANKKLSADKCHAVALDTNYLQLVYAPLWAAFANVNKDLKAFDKAAAASGNFAVPEYFFHAFRHYAGNLVWCMAHHPEFAYTNIY
ncbi:UNVERIFIED_CONTAM: hypothetical protein HDU68_009481 [Siphonaria sp. JEL0065]|nr:hypothetical protein HDU68_009481 [Siphonaria sp. JEL0065]